MSKLVFKNRSFFFTSLKGFIFFIIHNANGIFGGIALYTLAHIWMLLFGVGIVITKFSFALMWQINEMLKQKFKLNHHKVSKFCYYVILNLYFIMKIQRNYGNMFVVFLIIHVPINIVVMMWILLGKIEKSRLFFICTLLLGQIIGIFVCHYIMSCYTKVS